MLAAAAEAVESSTGVGHFEDVLWAEYRVSNERSAVNALPERRVDDIQGTWGATADAPFVPIRRDEAELRHEVQRQVEQALHVPELVRRSECVPLVGRDEGAQPAHRVVVQHYSGSEAMGLEMVLERVD